MMATEQKDVRVSRWWRVISLGVVLGLAGGLYFLNLDVNGTSNQYYAATVRSMLVNWSNFFFGSFDPAGFVTVDKPPVAFWVQAVSAGLLGFSGVAIILPQAIAGIFSVALLYYLVNRYFGHRAGILAALILATTPITVAMNRTNQPDPQLVLVLLLAAGAFLKAVELGKLRWLMVGVVLVGIGFNMKMLQAFVVLPVLYAVYFLGGKRGWWAKLGQLAVATGVLVVVSMSWAVVTDLTPTDQRPYIGSSSNNTVWQLITGHNGAARIFNGNGSAFAPIAGNAPDDVDGGQPNQFAPSGDGNGDGLVINRAQGPGDGGVAGLFRFFGSELGTQISWLLPLAFVAMVGAWLVYGVNLPLTHQQSGLLLWSGWLLIHWGLFSFMSGIFHGYYTVMVSPGLAAVAGIGVSSLWQAYEKGRLVGWWVFVGLLVTSLWSGYLLWRNDLQWVAFLLIGCGVLGLVGLVVAGWQVKEGKVPAWLTSLGLMGLLLVLVGPMIWSVRSVVLPVSGAIPTAGGQTNSPQRVMIGSPDGNNPPLNDGNLPPNGQPGQRPNRDGQLPLPGNGPSLNVGDRMVLSDELMDYLEAAWDGERFFLATANSMPASPIIIEKGYPVMAMGGFGGQDPILTAESLAQMVADGQVRFFWLPAAAPNAPANRPRLAMGQNEITEWVSHTCSVVPSTVWQANNSGATSPEAALGMQLYDCLSG